MEGGGLDCVGVGRNYLLWLGGVGRNYLGWLLPPGWGSSADQGHALARYSILDLVSPPHISLVYRTYSLKQSCPQLAQHLMLCSEATLQEILCWRSPLGAGLCLAPPAGSTTLSGEGGGGRLVSTSRGRDT